MKNLFLKKKRPALVFFLIFLLYLPFGFGKTHFYMTPNKSTVILPKSSINSFYLLLKLDSLGLSKEAFDQAINGYEQIVHLKSTTNTSILSIIDFTKLSSQKRLYILDVETGKLLFHTYVAHGRNSGLLYANNFSNTPSSLQSSLGFFQTGKTYNGKNGYSLQLYGLEKGINDNAFERSIVIHGASYVSNHFVKTAGYLGRSWGCPALPSELTKPIIDKIKNGTLLFIFAKDKNYFAKTSFPDKYSASF